MSGCLKMPDLKAGAVQTVCSVFRYETWSLNILQLCRHGGLLLTHRLLYGAIVLHRNTHNSSDAAFDAFE